MTHQDKIEALVDEMEQEYEGLYFKLINNECNDEMQEDDIDIEVELSGQVRSAKFIKEILYSSKKFWKDVNNRIMDVYAVRYAVEGLRSNIKACASGKPAALKLFLDIINKDVLRGLIKDDVDEFDAITKQANISQEARKRIIDKNREVIGEQTETDSDPE